MDNIIESLPLHKDCKILKTHSCGLFAVEKGERISSHPNSKKDISSAIFNSDYDIDEEFFYFEDLSKTQRKIYLINRLDSPTSGVLLCSTNKEVAHLARTQFKEKQVEKIYYAICIGNFFEKKGIWIDRVNIKKSRTNVRSQITQQGLKAVSKFFVEASNNLFPRLNLVKLEPKTGITHQLRVQAAKHHYPILGDNTYGNFNFNKKFRNFSKENRLFLHCLETKISFNYKNNKIDFQASSPLPKIFKSILQDQ